MDFINTGQLLGVILFFAGNFVLNWCSNWEKERQEELKDPKVRIANYNKDKFGLVKPTTTRGTLMTLAGLGLSIWGAVLFFMNIK